MAAKTYREIWKRYWHNRNNNNILNQKNDATGVCFNNLLSNKTARRSQIKKQEHDSSRNYEVLQQLNCL